MKRRIVLISILLHYFLVSFPCENYYFKIMFYPMYQCGMQSGIAKFNRWKYVLLYAIPHRFMFRFFFCTYFEERHPTGHNTYAYSHQCQAGHANAQSCTSRWKKCMTKKYIYTLYRMATAWRQCRYILRWVERIKEHRCSTTPVHVSPNTSEIQIQLPNILGRIHRQLFLCCPASFHFTTKPASLASLRVILLSKVQLQSICTQTHIHSQREDTGAHEHIHTHTHACIYKYRDDKYAILYIIDMFLFAVGQTVLI